MCACFTCFTCTFVDVLALLVRYYSTLLEVLVLLALLVLLYFCTSEASKLSTSRRLDWSMCLPKGEFTCFTCTFEEGERELLLYYEASTCVLVKQAKQVKQVPGGSWTGLFAGRSAHGRIH